MHENLKYSYSPMQTVRVPHFKGFILFILRVALVIDKMQKKTKLNG